MKIGVFDHGWWKTACNALGHQTTVLPVASHPSGNAYAADLGGRVATERPSLPTSRLLRRRTEHEVF